MIFAYTNVVKRELVEVHIAVFLFGFADLFGKIIALPSILIVFGRVVFASIFLLLILILTHGSLGLNVRGVWEAPTEGRGLGEALAKPHTHLLSDPDRGKVRSTAECPSPPRLITNFNMDFTSSPTLLSSKFFYILYCRN